MVRWWCDRGDRRTAQRRVCGVPVPDPFDLDTFVEAVARERGRPVHVEPIPPGEHRGGVCGLWIATDQADWVFVEESTSPLHREHIVLHEVGHLLRGHSTSAEDLVSLLPDIDPARVRAVLARSRYDDAQEREAEEFATSLLSGVRRPPSRGRSDVALDRATRVLQPRRR